MSTRVARHVGSHLLPRRYAKWGRGPRGHRRPTGSPGPGRELERWGSDLTVVRAEVRPARRVAGSVFVGAQRGSTCRGGTASSGVSRLQVGGGLSREANGWDAPVAAASGASVRAGDGAGGSGRHAACSAVNSGSWSDRSGGGHGVGGAAVDRPRWAPGRGERCGHVSGPPPGWSGPAVPRGHRPGVGRHRRGQPVGGVSRVARRSGDMGWGRRRHRGAWYACRRYHLRLSDVVWTAAPALPVAQAIGRLGNWFNQKLYGGPSSLPWAVATDPRTGRRPARWPPPISSHLDMSWCATSGSPRWWRGRSGGGGCRGGRPSPLYAAEYTAGRGWLEALRVGHANHLGGCG